MANQPPLPRRDWAGATAAAIIGGTVVGGLFLWGGWKIAGLYGSPWKHFYFFTCDLINSVMAAVFANESSWWQAYLASARDAFFIKAFLWLALAACLYVASEIYWRLAARVVDPFQHVAGRRHFQGREAEGVARAVSKKKIAVSGEGIKIHPAITLSNAQLLQSVMVMGAQGGGKTQIVWRLLLPMFQQNYKKVIFDLAKGDYTISSPSIDRLIALGDARSSVWAIWRDVRGIADAESFARGLIPESNDPMWSNAARLVMVAILLKLINEKGDGWRWEDVAALAYADAVEYKAIAAEHYPPALRAVEDAESKTTQGILINLSAFLSPLWRFAKEWQGYQPLFKSGKHREFSWIDWLNDDESTDRTIIIQSNKKDIVTSSALCRAMLEVQAGHICSLEFPESKTRKIVYLLDELPQLGRLECLSSIMEVGRSKGCALILAFQDISQIRQIFKQYEDSKWTALLGLRIFGMVKGGDSQKFVAEQIGKRTVERENESTTQDGRSSTSWTRQEIDVVHPAELERLGPHKKGVRGLVLGHGYDALELDWPYFSPPNIRKAKIALPLPQSTFIHLNSSPEGGSTQDMPGVVHEGHEAGGRLEPPLPLENNKSLDEAASAESSDFQFLNAFEGEFSGSHNHPETAPVNEGEFSEPENSYEEEMKVEDNHLQPVTNQALAMLTGIDINTVDAVMQVIDVTEEVREEVNENFGVVTPVPRRRKARKDRVVEVVF